MPLQHARLRFGAYDVDLHARELRKHGLRMKLENQPFEVLSALLENPGEIVTRAELQARLWPDGTFVDFDKSLTKAVNKLRSAFGDSASTPHFVETVSRHGYRFIAPVTFLRPDESTPITNTRGNQPARKEIAAGHSDWIRWALFVSSATVLLVLIGVIALESTVRTNRAGSPTGIHSLAVLPIQDLTGDAGQQYLADGLTDDLITDLATVGSLRVISYTSVMHYKGTRKALPEIARELRVDGILEGSLQRADTRIRVNMKFLQAESERQLWTGTYDVQREELERVEGQIAVAVARHVSARVTAEETTRVAETAATNPRAYEAYLRGRYLWNLRGGESIREAATYFEQAVRQDPRFALAWSGLADCYTVDWGARFDPALAERFARKALALDPNLAEAHVSLAFAQQCQFRFPDAAKEYEKGLALNPNYVPAHQFYAIYLLATDRALDALAENDRALQLDPFSLPVNNLRGHILVNLRQYDRALEQARKMAEMDAASWTHASLRARIYWIQDRVEDALVAEHDLTLPASGRPRTGTYRLPATLSPREACLRSVQLKEGASHPAYDVALQYGCLKDKQKVLHWMKRFADERAYFIIALAQTAPEFEFLRSDPDFQALLRHIGLSA